jgi:hypothetical protein
MSKYDLYLTYDKPIPLKGLLVYPAKMKDYVQFHFHATCLTMDKNSVPDARVISMSYLAYLYHATSEDEPYVLMLWELLKIVLKNENTLVKFSHDENNRAVLIIDDVVLMDSDFDELREIIILQNGLELPDDNIQKELREELENARRKRMEANNAKMSSLEDQMICVMISTPLHLDDIYELTIRKFVKILKRVDQKLHYQIYMSASMSGFVEFKDKSVLSHWMMDVNNDKYKDVKIDLDEMSKKISFEDLKENQQ